MENINKTNGYKLGIGWLCLLMASAMFVGWPAIWFIFVWGAINWHYKRSQGTMASQAIPETEQLPLFTEATRKDQVTQQINVVISQVKKFIRDHSEPLS